MKVTFMGAILIAIGFIGAYGANMFKKVPNQQTTIGTVVSCKYTSNGQYDGIVEYVVDGKGYHIEEGYGHYSTGRKEKIAYNTENPTEAFIVPSTGKYLGLAPWFILGVAMIYSAQVLGDETVFGLFG